MIRPSDLVLAAIGAASIVTWLGASPAERYGSASKGDRLVPRITEGASSTPLKTVPLVVEVIGLDAAVFVLLDKEGRELFRSDTLRDTTLVAREADLPVLKVGLAREERLSAPVSTTRRSKSAPPVDRNPMLGCEGVVSPLADKVAARILGRCLAKVDHGELDKSPRQG